MYSCGCSHRLSVGESKKIKLETKVGIFQVEKEKDLILIKMQKPKIIEFKHNQEEVSKLLGIEQKELDLRYPIQIISVGKEKLLVPLLSLAGLLKINPDLKGIKEYCKKSGANGFFSFH